MLVADSLKNDKRREERLAVHLPVCFCHRGSFQKQSSITRDLSNSGLRLVSDNLLPKETSILLELELKELPQILNLSGRVAWIKNLGLSHKYHMGVEFRDLNKEAKVKLEEYLKLKLALS